MKQFSNLFEVLSYYSSDDNCRNTLEKIRWPDGNIICPKCKTDRGYRMGDMKNYKCRDKKCGIRFTITQGTIYEATKLHLSKWFAAMYLLSAHKKGISSCQLARDLGIGQKAAWFLLTRIRESWKNKSIEKMDNIVEVDECYVGGSLANMHRGRRKKIQESGNDNKTAVMGLIEREGQAKLTVIGEKNFKEIIRENVDENAMIVTDSHLGYKGLAFEFVGHATIDHSKEQFKDGIFHTNSIEGTFSHFKRMILGIYHQVSPKHLEKYCTEFNHRFNSRKIKDTERFNLTIQKIDGRIKWKDLSKK